MVSGSFTSQMRDEGSLLTRLLEKAGVAVRASLWLYEAELNSWRFLVSTDDVDRTGPRSVYGKIRSVITRHSMELSEIDLKDISVVSPKDSLIRSLAKAVRVDPAADGIRFSRSQVSGHYIDDTFIYRLPSLTA